MRILGFLLAIGVTVGLLVAAPVPKKKQKDYGAVTEEQLKEANKRMKLLILAMHNYESAYGHLPNDITDKDGKPLLSWRLALLPYVEDENTELYKQFKLDEAWDSENNKKLIEKLPKIYAPIRVETEDAGHTFVQGFEGKGVVFQPGKKLTIISITDGTSNTIGVLEAETSTPWTKPGGLPFDEKKDLPGFGGELEGDFHIGFLDGSVRFVKKKNMDAKEFKKFITISDGLAIDTEKAIGKE
jgi:Protein of unknown function (DUF1559)